jgi:hypothetical protein
MHRIWTFLNRPSHVPAWFTKLKPPKVWTVVIFASLCIAMNLLDAIQTYLAVEHGIYLPPLLFDSADIAYAVEQNWLQNLIIETSWVSFFIVKIVLVNMLIIFTAGYSRVTWLAWYALLFLFVIYAKATAINVFSLL